MPPAKLLDELLPLHDYITAAPLLLLILATGVHGLCCALMTPRRGPAQPPPAWASTPATPPSLGMIAAAADVLMDTRVGRPLCLAC